MDQQIVTMVRETMENIFESVLEKKSVGLLVLTTGEKSEDSRSGLLAELVLNQSDENLVVNGRLVDGPSGRVLFNSEVETVPRAGWQVLDAAARVSKQLAKEASAFA